MDRREGVVKGKGRGRKREVQSYMALGTGVILTQAMVPELSGEITPHAGPQFPEISVAYIRYSSTQNNG